MSAELLGVDELLEALRSLPEVMADELRPLISSGADEIKALAKDRVPTDEFDLQKDIDAEVAGDGMSATVGNRNVWYAFHTEFGTEDTPAQPYLFPAFNQVKNRVRRDARNAGRELGRKVSSRVKRHPKTRTKKA